MAEGYPWGFGLDETLEREIESRLTELIEIVEEPDPDYSVIVDQTDEILHITRQVRHKADVDKDGLATGECEQAGGLQVALFGEMGVHEAHQCWRQQQAMNVRETLCVLQGTPHDAVRQRVRSRLLESIGRPTAVLEALGEVKKVGLLLSGQSSPVELSPGEKLSTTSMCASSDTWLHFGAYRLTDTPEGLRFKNKEKELYDAMMWTRDVFSGDHLVRLICTPHAGAGGVIFAICGKARPGKDLSESAQKGMEPYNHGIDAYHVSVHREGTGVTNLRRPGKGLKMLATLGPDPCEAAERSYEIWMLKWRSSLLFFVDGKLIHHYYDAEVYGPVLQEGQMGIRHWRSTDVTYRDFQMHRLVKK